MKREEADYMQDTSNKQTERIKVSEIDIIVSMINGKPYYEIKYKKVGEDYYHIGYSSYNLDFVLEWKRKCFALVRERKSVAGWIPVSERLPEESGLYLTWVKCDNEEFMSIEEIDCEGILKEWNFTGEVLYWMPLPEPYRESEDKNGK